MQPQTQTKPQPDLQALALTKAIRAQESGGNYNASGDNATSTGAYQYQANTWKQYSKQVLGVENAPMTPENQNAVTYGMIKTWKDSGMGPAQIAAKWNSGSENGWENKVGTTTINGKAIPYNVPQYVQGVVSQFKQIYPQVQSQFGSPQEQSVSDQTQPKSVSGFFNNLFSSAGNVAGGVATAVGNIFNPDINKNTIANIVRTGVGATESVSNGLFGTHFDDPNIHAANAIGDYFTKRYGGSSPGDIVKNIGNTLYKDPVGAALDLSTFLDGVGGAIGAVGKVGDVAKATELAQASDFISTASGILKSGSPEAIKALTEKGTLSKISDAVQTAADYINPISPFTKAMKGAGGVINWATDNLPRRMVNQLLPQLKREGTLDYAVENLKLGDPETMLEGSQASMNAYNKQIQTILTHPEYAATKVFGDKILADTLDEFPKSEYTSDIVIQKLKTQIPSEAATLTKLQKGTINLDEANALRQALDRASYKLGIDSPEVKAGKDLANAMANTLRKTVQNEAPETATIFSNYGKEIDVWKAIKKMAQREGKKKFITFRDMVSTLGGNALGGPVGAIAGLGLEKLSESPVAKVAVAKGLRKLAPIAGKVAGKIQAAAPVAGGVIRAGNYANQAQTNR